MAAASNMLLGDASWTDRAFNGTACPYVPDLVP